MALRGPPRFFTAAINMLKMKEMQRSAATSLSAGLGDMPSTSPSEKLPPST
jgi:hypothetical protein